MSIQTTWERFAAFNMDGRGLRFKFEDLCRQLFTNEFLSPNRSVHYLRSNPNNAGLETDPIYDEKSKRWIGFQAKYYSGRPNYNDILDSAKKIVAKYKGKVNHVYLYCNKKITDTSTEYLRTVELLRENGITIEDVTDDIILDRVRMYPYLQLYYFTEYDLSYEWFVERSSLTLDDFGSRYNRALNVDTTASKDLSIFVQDEDAVIIINGKKKAFKKRVQEYYWQYSQYQYYFDLIALAVNNISDVTQNTLYESLEWETKVSKAVENYTKTLQSKDVELQSVIEQDQRSLEFAVSKEEQENLRKKISDSISNQRIIETLLELPKLLEVSERERWLLAEKVLFVTGAAGTGKSHMLAQETQKLIDEKRCSLLLPAWFYFSEDPIQEQIIKGLELECNLLQLFDVLDAIGQRDGKIVPIFIDAINETWHRDLWKNSLSSIIEEVRKREYIKLVITYRPEYKGELIAGRTEKLIENGEIPTIVHRGFEDNSMDAIRRFLAHYGIPFTPLSYFRYEMSNPLFLSIYCKTYNGEEVELPELYENLIVYTDRLVFKQLRLNEKGYAESDHILSSFVDELALKFAEKQSRFIERRELNELSFWKDYSIAAGAYISLLQKEGFLYSYKTGDQEIFYFAFDQMNDYYCARAIVNKRESKEKIKDLLVSSILCVEDGEIGHCDAELFASVCALYAEKYHEECIDVLDEANDSWEKSTAFNSYISSLKWRRSTSLPSGDVLLELIRKYPYDPERLWDVLIENSVKENNPLNADFLHGFLSSYPMNKRDYLWTLEINKYSASEENRLIQLIEMLEKGEDIRIDSKKKYELLLTMFSWLLTSSDRWLRDHTSKAMIEILKKNFDLCIVLLQKFQGVNDPYIIQRLFGIVFGACCKKTNDNVECYQELAKHVYSEVFDCDLIYPDILLRDYARLIIEKFLYDYPEYSGLIEKARICPPYNSESLPEKVKEDFTEKECNGGLYRIAQSMKFEGMGMYGDFGRYVYQSALKYFDVDTTQIYNYSIKYILDELGYREDYFGENDCNNFRYPYDRHDTMKCERIGKKYQWITMYNVLARVADQCKMVDKYSLRQTDNIIFEGAWEPYVRDFDPTLNQYNLNNPSAPVFKAIDEFINCARKENSKTDVSDDEKRKKWLTEEGSFLSDFSGWFSLKDENGIDWVGLNWYCDTGYRNMRENTLYIWGKAIGLFVRKERVRDLEEYIVDEKNGQHEFRSAPETYTVYNREYPWSPSCKDLLENSVHHVMVDSGETELVKVIVPDFSGLDYWFDRLGEDEKKHENEPMPKIQYEERIVEKKIERELGTMLYATVNLLWEEEFDASKEQTISRSFPCAELIQHLRLQQTNTDCFFCDQEDQLAAFDLRLTQGVNCTVIRKDLLDKFLKEKDYILLWIGDAEKEIHGQNTTIEKWSEWSGYYTYDGSTIKGKMRLDNLR